jgi:hypothetical protein
MGKTLCCMETQGGEGVGWVVRYLWYTPYTEKAKMETLQERTKWNN